MLKLVLPPFLFVVCEAGRKGSMMRTHKVIDAVICPGLHSTRPLFYGMGVVARLSLFFRATGVL